MSREREIGNKIGRMMREIGEERRKFAEQRKNEFLHTRVSDELKEKIKKAADRSGIPTSILIRNILEDYFSNVERLDNVTSAGKNKMAGIIGWQEFVTIKEQICASCGRPAKKGEKVFRGMGENGETIGIHCGICVSEFMSK